MRDKVRTILKEWLQSKDDIVFTDDIAIEEVADEIVEACRQECIIPVVSGSLPLASADKIMERIVPKYRDANPHDRAIIAGICDEVLDQSGRFLGEVRTRAMESNDR